MAFCSQCGTKLPDGARFCPGCGTAADGAAPPIAAAPPPETAFAPPPRAGVQHQPPLRPDGGVARFILPLMIVVALAVIAYYVLGGPRERAAQETAGLAGQASAPEASDAPAAGPAPRTGNARYASATVLDAAFFSDPQGAALRYPGPVEVSGTIASMVQPGPTPALSMEGRTRFNYVIVNFPAGYRTRLAPLMKGQSITVSCRSVTALAGNTILQDCTLP